jgi:aryl-alcohol dehydrogenase-like predicted oxidoreductase
MGITRRDLLKGSAAITALSAIGVNPLTAQPGGLITKVIPKSGEMIPPIGIGTNRYGGDNSEEQRAPLRATLQRFHELGGKVIDTAPLYRNAEEVLGDLIDDPGLREDLFMATKCNMMTTAESHEQMEQSIAKLQWDVIDLMQVHNLIGWQEQLPAMQEWKQEGRIRYTGLTTSQGRQYDELAAIMQVQDVDFIQVNYSLDDRAAADRLLPMAAEKGMAVFINLPFGRGRLFEAVAGRELPDWSKEFDCHSWGQFFLKYIISHPAVTVAIPGTRKPHHAEDNLGAAMGRLPDAVMRKRQEDYLDSL